MGPIRRAPVTGGGRTAEAAGGIVDGPDAPGHGGTAADDDELGAAQVAAAIVAFVEERPGAGVGRAGAGA